MLTYQEWLKEYEGFSRNEVVPVAASKFKDLISRSDLKVSCTTISADGQQEFYFHDEAPKIRYRMNTASNAKIVVWVDLAERELIYETTRGGSVKRMVVGNDSDFDTLVKLLDTKCANSSSDNQQLDDSIDGIPV